MSLDDPEDKSHSNTETWVGLFRNGFCVAKDVLPKSHFLQQPALGKYPGIDLLIGPLQAAASVFNVVSAISTLLGTKGSLAKLGMLAVAFDATVVDAKTEAKGKTAALREVARATSELKTRRFVAWCKLVIGPAFAILAASTFQFLSATLSRIYWALSYMEVALLSLLCVMLIELRGLWTTRATLLALADELEAAHLSAKAVPAKAAELVRAIVDGASAETLEILSPPNKPTAKVCVEEILTNGRGGELHDHAIFKSVEEQLVLVAASLTPGAAGAAEAPAKLRAKAGAARLEAALLVAVWLLNVVAFFGYMAFPIAFFAPDEKQVAATLAAVVTWPGHARAEYLGNLAGDLAWTVEPALVLFVTPLIPRLAGQVSAKPKVA